MIRPKPGTFMMVITPGVDLKPLANGADYCFVLDVSGSMQSKMKTLKRGVLKAMEKLQTRRPISVFDVFQSGSRIDPRMDAGIRQSLIKAREMIELLNAGGSTNLYAGLSLALKNLDDDRAANIILVTDAVTNTGVVNPEEFYKLLQQVDIRILAFCWETVPTGL